MSSSATTASTTTTITATAPVHILVFPYPAQGHMLPILDLTHLLALQGFKITILVTPKNLHILNPLLSFHHPNPIQTLVLPFPPHTDLPSGVEHVKDVGNSGNVPIMASLSKLEEPVIQWFQSHPQAVRPMAILSDFFLGCTQRWAEKLGIPRIGFFSSGVFLTSVLAHLWPNVEILTDNSGSENNIVEFPGLPGSPSFVKEHLPSVVRRYKKGHPDLEIIKEGMLANFQSWGLVFNSFHALEYEYFEHMKEELGHGRVFGVGPLSIMPGSETLRRVNPGFEQGSDDVFSWLDKCPNGSVLYVCFGSQKELTRDQTQALAMGLERSGKRFLWVVKSNGWTPDGFEDRVVGRGLVLKGWAPQLKILSHHAVGGFLSHCGWNSVLESIATGVMVLGWPMEADQFVNARILVEDRGLAVQVCAGGSTVPDPDELARVIWDSIDGNVAQKGRVRVMRDKAVEGVVKEGGKSRQELEEFVKELKNIGASKSTSSIIKYDIQCRL